MCTHSFRPGCGSCVACAEARRAQKAQRLAKMRAEREAAAEQKRERQEGRLLKRRPRFFRGGDLCRRHGVQARHRTDGRRYCPKCYSASHRHDYERWQERLRQAAYDQAHRVIVMEPGIRRVFLAEIFRHDLVRLCG